MSEPEDQAGPKTFISYSWTSEEHKERVLALANKLVGDRVDILLDRYALRPGDDRFAYMERSVTDPSVTKVLAITDRAYKDKMDGRKGGVGIEGTIMSAKVYQQISGEKNKFVAVVFEVDENGNALLPAMFDSKFYIDMSTDELLEANYEQLVRFLYDRPLLKRPALGRRPSYLLEDDRPALITAGKAAAVREAVNRDRLAAARGHLADYLDSLGDVLAAMPRAIKDGLQPDPELALREVERFVPYRNEFAQLLHFLGRHAELASIELLPSLTSFFERAIGQAGRLAEKAGLNEAAFDHVLFAAHSLFLYSAALLWKARKVNEVITLLDHAYFVESGRGGPRYTPYSRFSEYLKMFEDTGQYQRGIAQGGIMQKFADGGVLAWVEVCEADALLWLRSIFRSQERWYPRTVAFWDRMTAFPTFARAESRRNILPLAHLLGVKVEALKSRLEAAETEGRGLLASIRPWFDLKTHFNLQRFDSQA